MKLHRQLLYSLAGILLALLLLFQFVAWGLARQTAEARAIEDAERVSAILMSVRRVYHRAFIDANLELNEQTLPLLPAFAMTRIANELKSYDNSGFTFNNVSDQARDHQNLADAEELKALAFFRENPKAERYTAQIVDTDGRAKLLYARPIWIEPYCLKCHGNPEDAPPSIRARYTTAFGYKLGDLRGVLSIKLPKEQVALHAWRDFRWQLLISLAIFFVAGTILIWRLRRDLARPLASVSEAARRLATGDLAARAQPASSIDEVQAVAESFNRMAASLGESQKALADSEARLFTTLSSIGDAVISTDAAGRIEFMNPVAEALTGWSMAEAAGLPIGEVFRIVNEQTGESMENPVARVLREGIVVGLANHTLLLRRDGEKTPIADAGAPIRDKQGRVSGVVLVFRDVTRERLAQKKLAESEARYRLLAEHGRDCITFEQPTGSFSYVSPSALSVFGVSAEELKANGEALPNRMVHEEDRRRWHAHLEQPDKPAQGMELRLTRPDGEIIWIEHDCTPVYEQGHYLGRRGAFRDITARKKAEAEAERLANHDLLTGLPNRRHLVQRLEQELSTLPRKKILAALILINLSGFKRLNEARGEAFGNQVLIAVAERLQHTLREGDLVARAYGDEFALLLTNLDNRIDQTTKQIATVLTKLQQAISAPIFLESEEITLAACFGITHLPASSGDNAEAVLRRADTALHRAKAKGAGEYAFFEAAMGEAARLRFELEKELRRALARDELRLFLQSQVDGSGRTIGAEVLLRWQHPERGLIPPGQFVPIAEESKLILDLGAWVLREACRLIRRTLDEGRPLRLSVNLSARQFRQPGFEHWLTDLIEAHGADPALLTLEVTESLAIEDFAVTVGRMHAMRTTGLHFSLDDFGTGYSSLAYLKRLPLSEIKIDKSFILDAPQDSDDAALVDTILAVARQLKLRVVAEGVETALHAAFLDGKGEIVRQGYYYGKPIPVEDWLKAWQ
ncbi:MAG: EAL domain-containing protein [Rhodocyclaceae bacterium]|nr:EAL domain-containing protein [Rhodocyclaceae bacterium]